MGKFMKWWYKHHPFSSKYKVVRFMWFIFAAVIGTLLCLFPSLYTGLKSFYEEMVDWFVDLKHSWRKVINKETN